MRHLRLRTQPACRLSGRGLRRLAPTSLPTAGHQASTAQEVQGPDDPNAFVRGAPDELPRSVIGVATGVVVTELAVGVSWSGRCGALFSQQQQLEQPAERGGWRIARQLALDRRPRQSGEERPGAETERVSRLLVVGL